MAPLSVTFSGPKGHFSYLYLKNFYTSCLGKYITFSLEFVVSQKEYYVVYNFNCRNEDERLFKVTGSHVCWKSG